ncbi:hypothetical protein EYF80_036076 [Liparis tanakae]|uniref:Uncharacterized protein n=1 Tax=Liparis tanakae TaxID=230148 RepID=A0A4Z2GJR3_9TELE|nr:hypothetical protein EYF80_036076 [Liparis tanakae]
MSSIHTEDAPTLPTLVDVLPGSSITYVIGWLPPWVRKSLLPPLPPAHHQVVPCRSLVSSHQSLFWSSSSSSGASPEARGPPGKAWWYRCRGVDKKQGSKIQYGLNQRLNYLVPQCTGHLVDDGAEFPVLPGVSDVGPGAERDQRQAQDHVTQAGDDVHAHEARDARRHVHHEDDHEQGGRRPGRVENVLGVVVLDVLDEHLVHFALQLLQVAAAELLAAHLLHHPEHLQGLLPDGAVSGLQLTGSQEGPVAAADLGKPQWRRSMILCGCYCGQIVRLCCGLRGSRTPCDSGGPRTYDPPIKVGVGGHFEAGGNSYGKLQSRTRKIMDYERKEKGTLIPGSVCYLQVLKVVLLHILRDVVNLKKINR